MPGLAFRRTAAFRYSVVLMLFGIGFMDAPSMLAMLAVVTATAVVPMRRPGWATGGGSAAKLADLAMLVVVLATFMLMPEAALAAGIGLSALRVAAAAAARYTDTTAEMPPDYDWRNTPNAKHPGGDMCPCPRHTRMRKAPGVLFLCKDCMYVFFHERPPHASRSLRVLLWLARNLAAGKFFYVREARDPDDCYFCSSSGGGLGRRTAPPPDAH